MAGELILPHNAASPSAPAASYTKIYTKTDGQVYAKIPDGTEILLGLGVVWQSPYAAGTKITMEADGGIKIESGVRVEIIGPSGSVVY